MMMAKSFPMSRTIVIRLIPVLEHVKELVIGPYAWKMIRRILLLSLQVLTTRKLAILMIYTFQTPSKKPLRQHTQFRIKMSWKGLLLILPESVHVFYYTPKLSVLKISTFALDGNQTLSECICTTFNWLGNIKRL